MDERIESIKVLRNTTDSFLDGNLEFIKFYETISFELGATFDPLDWTTKDLDKTLVNEIMLYFKFTGGDFGEYKDFLPKNKDWKYGESDVQYGWIDTVQYKELLKLEYSQLKLKEL